MVKQVFTIYDIKSEFHGTPMLYHNEEDAKRGITSIFSRPESVFCQHPEDYKIYHLGSFNDNSGVITPLEKPAFIGELANLNPHPEEA